MGNVPNTRDILVQFLIAKLGINSTTRTPPHGLRGMLYHAKTGEHQFMRIPQRPSAGTWALQCFQSGHRRSGICGIVQVLNTAQQLGHLLRTASIRITGAIPQSAGMHDETGSAGLPSGSEIEE